MANPKPFGFLQDILLIAAFSLGVMIGIMISLLIDNTSEVVSPTKAVETATKAVKAAENQETKQGAIALAARRKVFAKKASEEFGLDFVGNFFPPEDPEEILDRAKKNPKLANAFKKAKEQEVVIVVADQFKIYRSKIWIDAKADDSKIIKFLIGPN